ncbi:MAG TPA: sortase, partial [Patescibacteria group bacterium]|nr:sortase [Patescibacteria group bacterium]
MLIPVSSLKYYPLPLIFLIPPIVGLLLLLRPALLAEFTYHISRPGFSRSFSKEVFPNPETIPRDQNFGIKIPKIGADSKIFANVDPFDKEEYENYLKQGVAHAAGSSLPEELGNVFLFAHSTATLWESREYNAVFYLLNKLDP